MGDKGRPYGQPQSVVEAQWERSANSSKGSYAERWTDAEVQRIRGGQAKPLFDTVLGVLLGRGSGDQDKG